MINSLIILTLVIVQLSLLATVIRETIASLFSVRGKNLEEALKRLLEHKEEKNLIHGLDTWVKKMLHPLRKVLGCLKSDSRKTLFEVFINHSFYKQIHGRKFWWNFRKNRSPAYLEPVAFRRILFQVILRRYNPKGNKEELPSEVIKLTHSNKFILFEQAINRYKDDFEQYLNDGQEKSENQKNQEIEIPLPDNLLALLEEAKYEGVPFEEKIESWYNEMMDRASGWYKRKTQAWLFAIGFALAFSFDADMIEMFGKVQEYEMADETAMMIAEVVEKDSAMTISQLQEETKPIFKDLADPLGMNGALDAIRNEMQTVLNRDTVFDIVFPLPLDSSSGVEFGKFDSLPGGLNRLGVRQIRFDTLMISHDTIDAVQFLAIYEEKQYSGWRILKRLVNLRYAGKVPETNADNRSSSTRGNRRMFTDAGEEIVG